MQPTLEPPRDTLTAADVAAVIEGDELHVTAGLELLDGDGDLIADISDDLVGGEIECGNYRTIHRTCRLTVARRLVWASQRVRPYLTLSDAAVRSRLLAETGDTLLTESGGDLLTEAAAAATVEARFNLGVYLLDTPAENLEDVDVFEVEGYDLLDVLNQPHGASYRIAAGTAYLTAVSDLITDAGETAPTVDPAEAATTAPSDRVWPLDESTTTLQIINDLLAAVNYRALWVDWDGRFRCTPYASPSTTAAEWTYNADSASTSIVGETRTRERDFYATPNRWVGVRNDPTDSLPVDGDGRYETVNQSDGDTSIDARGRTITRTLFLDAADQDSLVAQVDAAKEEDMRVNVHRMFTTGPNPLHWHFDVCELVDAAAGPTVNAVWVSWLLPLDGGDMTHETREVG